MLQITVHGAKTLREVDPRSRAGNDKWFRYDWVPTTGIQVEATGGRAAPTWSIQGRHPARIVANSQNPNRATIYRSIHGDRLDVTCRSGSDSAHVRIWIIKGEVRVRNSGHMSDSRYNSAWRTAARALHLSTSSHPSLGLFSSSHNGETHYGALVEIVGIVAPWDVPSHFYLARTISSTNITASNCSVPEQREAGDDDTSDRSLQDRSLSNQGKVYDIDAPGSYFDSNDPVNARHSWDVTFEEMLVIGQMPRSNAWQDATRRALGVSPSQRWRANYSATVTRAGSPPTVQLSGTVGESL